MPARTQWVKIFDVNPRVIARHAAPIICPVNQVAGSIREWFPNPSATIRDAVNALQRTLSIGGCVDGLCRLLNISVESVPEQAGDKTTADEGEQKSAAIGGI